MRSLEAQGIFMLALSALAEGCAHVFVVRQQSQLNRHLKRYCANT